MRIFACLLIILSLASCKEDDNYDLGKNTATKGKVSQLKVIVYSIKNKLWNERKVVKYVSNYYYNESRYLMEEIYSHPDKTGKLDTGLMVKYLYNNDRITVKDIYYPNNQGKPGMASKIIHQIIYQNDSCNTPIVKEAYSLKNNHAITTAYKYDARCNLIESRNYDNYGNFIGKNIYKYNTHNKLIESNSFANEKSLEVRVNYEYDQKDSCIMERIFAFYSNLGSGVIAYKYDEAGNVIEKNYHNYDDGSRKKFTFKYDSIDKGGNWLKKYVSINGKLFEVVQREIKYY